MGVDSGRWAEAGESVEFGRGGKAGVDSGVVGSDAVAAVAEGREQRWGVRWSMGSKGSDCAKGISSRRWAAAWEGVGFGPGGWGGNIYCARPLVRTCDW
jgi:hypothetical protein